MYVEGISSDISIVFSEHTVYTVLNVVMGVMGYV